jgi:hypothetical protein
MLVALVGGWFIKKGINTKVSIYFLGYLFWTSAITWHKVTWPKTSKCKYTNTRATLKVLKNAIFFQTHTSCLIKPSPPMFPHIPPICVSLYVRMFLNTPVRHPYILIHPYILLIRPYVICILILNPLVAFDLFLYLYLDLIRIEEELKGVGGFRLRHRIG